MYRSLTVFLFAVAMTACAALPPPQQPLTGAAGEKPEQQPQQPAPAEQQPARPLLYVSHNAGATRSGNPTPGTESRSDNVRYSLREQQARALEQFRGGEKIVIIGISTGAAILIAVVLLIIFV